MTSNKNFSPVHHIPRYSLLILQSLRTPILVYIAVIGNVLTFGFAAVFWFAERFINPNVESYMDALWWAFCTVSTVGYGDIVPFTTLGRLLAMVLMVVGVIFFVGFTALLVAIITPMAIQEQLVQKKDEGNS